LQEANDLLRGIMTPVKRAWGAVWEDSSAIGRSSSWCLLLPPGCRQYFRRQVILVSSV